MSVVPHAGGRLLEPGDLLPGVTLEDSRGRSVSWTRSGLASVVMFPHPGDCDDCRAFVTELAGATEDLATWGSRPLLVLPAAGTVAGDRPSDLPYPVLRDPDGRARARCVGEADAAVIVADQWGAVIESAAADPAGGHPFPATAVLVRRAMNLGIACPECGVADGGWATVSPVPLG